MCLSIIGCQSDTPGKTGTYTAARHTQTGSNIPLPSNASSNNDTMSTSDLERVGSSQNMSAARAMSGGAR